MSDLVEFVTVFDHMPQLLELMPEAAALAVDQWTEEVETEAEDNAPVESGTLQSSGYRITPSTNTYAEATSRVAEGNNDPVGDQPDVAVESGEAAIGFAVYYAGFVHDGHHTASGSFVAGQPFLADAVAAHQDELVDRVREQIEYLATLGVLE